MIEAILAETLQGILSDALGAILKQPVKRMLDERDLQRSLIAAIKRAEERFARDNADAELTHALMVQTRFADLPGVRSAIKEMLTHPFHDPTQTVGTLQHSFSEVLPSRVDRARIDQAVNSFLHSLGEEVLYIPQLQDLYTLAFQKVSAESNRNIAANTTALVESLQDLRNDIRQLPTSSPALPTLARLSKQVPPWHNLPQRTYTRFVGREAEVQKLTQLLLPYPRSRHFLVTLDGIGGVGKSALALEMAYHYRDNYTLLPLEERFEAIVWVSAKRALLTAKGVQQRQQTFSTLGDLHREIATVLELPLILQVDGDQRRGLVEHALTSTRTLLIIDNLETVDEEEVLTFLHELPDPTKAIVTTRHRIDIAYAIRLTGMPRTDALAFIALETAQKSIDLETAAVEELYRRTGGIPLAIVWSIALMGLGYSPESVLRRLGSGHSDIARFCFQESISSIRHRNAYHVLAALAFFETSVNRKMLGEVAGLGDDEIGRDDALAELLQSSLVNQERDRFTLLPLTRSFVLDTLKQESELDQLLHEQWVKHLTDFARPYMDLYWLQYELRQILQEGMHLVTLVSWCQSVGQLDVVLKVFPALAIYYDHMGQWTDLLTIGQVSLEHAQLTGDSEIVVFIETHAMSFVLSQQGRYAEAEQYISHALEVAQHLSDVSWQCEVLVDSSRIMRRRNRFDEAVERCQQALGLVTPPNNRRQVYLKSYVEYELGKIARDRGDWHTAQVHFLAARDVFRHDQSDPVFNRELAWGILGNLGFVAHQLGDLAGAEQMYLQALPRYRELGSRSNIPVLLVRLATLEEQRGKREAALKYADEALGWSQKLGMVREQAQAKAISARLSKGDLSFSNEQTSLDSPLSDKENAT